MWKLNCTTNPRLSILYKTKLPFVLVFNKTDVVSHEFASEWMQDYESLRTAIEQETSYMGTLIQSMGLVLDEFYQHLKVFLSSPVVFASLPPPIHQRYVPSELVGVSSLTGAGIDKFFEAVQQARKEYET